MSSELTRLQFVTKAADMVGRQLAGTARSGATHQSLLEEMYEWGQLRIARAYMFPELDIRDTTTTDTVASTFGYSYTTLFGAGARVRDVLSVVLEDGTSSNKLKRYTHQQMIQRYPYPEGETSRKSVAYFRLGNTLYFFPVPDAAYDIHTIRSKYPDRAAGDGSYSDYDDKDDVLLAAIISEYFGHLQETKEMTFWDRVFRKKLVEATQAIVHPSDWEPEGRAFNSSVLTPGDFWSDPLVMGNP